MEFQLKTQFDDKDVAYVNAFRAGMEPFNWEAVKIDTAETENDSLVMAPFSIQLVEGSQMTHSVLGDVSTPRTEFVVRVDTMTYSFNGGEEWDAEECARESSLADALKACAMKEYTWMLDNVLNGISERQESNIHFDGKDF